MFEKIAALIAEELSVSKQKITTQTKLQDDLGADSLDAVELMMSIEDSFHITIPEDKATSFRTVGDIVNFLETQTA